MSWIEGPEAIELARALLAEVPADEAELTLDCVLERAVRFAADGPTQSVERARVDVAVRVRIGASGAWREARAACAGAGREDVRAAGERALAIARASAASESAVPLGGEVACPRTRACEATRAHGFEEKARWISEAIDACRGADLVPAGLARTSALARCLVNSRGRAVAGASSRASFALTAAARGGGSPRDRAEGFAEEIASSVRELEPRRVVRRAVEKALAARSPRELAPGDYAVVLEPPAVAALLALLQEHAFGAREIEDGSSFLAGRLGECLFSERITIQDDARHPAHQALGFDGEGTPRPPLVLVDRGVARGPVTDRAAAARLGLASTGHARARESASGPGPDHLVLAPGEADARELVAGVARGLLVSRLHYVNLIDPRELSATGTTRDGTWWIEDGEVRHPVRNLRFTDSLASLLASVRAVGRELTLAGAPHTGEVATPPLLVGRMRFTSGAGS